LNDAVRGSGQRSLRASPARLVTRLAIALLAATALAWSGLRLSSLRGFQFFGELVNRVETTAPIVALTFDDGPTPTGTDSILAILRREGIRATFFLTGSETEMNPDLAARIVEDGHELGNHSWSHRRMVLKSPGFIRDEVERTDSLLRRAGHDGPIHFRPPYGKKLLGLPWYLARTGRTTITWDVEPESYPEVDGDTERIVAHVLENSRPGSIILLHVMYPGRRATMRSVEGIVRGLRERGLEFVTVSELLSRAGSEAESQTRAE